jgi:hypothetical protein
MMGSVVIVWYFHIDCFCSLITVFLLPGTSPLELVVNPTTQASSLKPSL